MAPRAFASTKMNMKTKINKITNGVSANYVVISQAISLDDVVKSLPSRLVFVCTFSYSRMMLQGRKF